MRRGALPVVSCLVVALVFSSSRAGRPDDDSTSWFGQTAAGYSSPQADLGDLVHPGVALRGGALYWPRAWPVGIDVGLGYNRYDIESETVFDLEDVTGNDVEIWSLTADAMWGPRPGGPVSAYLVAGIGAHRVRPVAGDSTTRPGYEAGAGLTFQLGRGSQIFLEAVYHRVATSPTATEYIPLVLGYRW